MKEYTIEIKWGMIFAIMGLVWMFIERSVGFTCGYKYVVYSS
jgi:hypothetical protein